MTLTVEELAEKLAQTTDEVTLLDLLGINSFELVERFIDRIEDKYDLLILEVEEDVDTD